MVLGGRIHGHAQCSDQAPQKGLTQSDLFWPGRGWGQPSSKAQASEAEALAGGRKATGQTAGPGTPAKAAARSPGNWNSHHREIRQLPRLGSLIPGENEREHDLTLLPGERKFQMQSGASSDLAHPGNSVAQEAEDWPLESTPEGTQLGSGLRED